MVRYIEHSEGGNPHLGETHTDASNPRFPDGLHRGLHLNSLVDRIFRKKTRADYNSIEPKDQLLDTNMLLVEILDRLDILTTELTSSDKLNGLSAIVEEFTMSIDGVVEGIRTELVETDSVVRELLNMRNVFESIDVKLMRISDKL